MLRFQLWDCVATTTQDGGESLILLYGRTSVADGDRDLCLRVSGLYAYIYIPQPAQTSASSSPVEALDKALGRRGGGGSVFRGAELVRRTDVVGFSTPANFWKLTLRDHRAIYNLKELVNSGEVASNFSRKSYLTDFPYPSLAQIELGIPNCGWGEIDDSLLTQQCAFRMSSCTLEYALPSEHVPKPGAPSEHTIRPLDEKLWAAMPSRVRVASLDIECAGRRGVFPTPDVDPIIQIGKSQATQYAKTLTAAPTQVPLWS